MSTTDINFLFGFFVDSTLWDDKCASKAKNLMELMVVVESWTFSLIKHFFLHSPPFTEWWFCLFLLDSLSSLTSLNRNTILTIAHFLFSLLLLSLFMIEFRSHLELVFIVVKKVLLYTMRLPQKIYSVSCLILSGFIVLINI